MLPSPWYSKINLDYYPIPFSLIEKDKHLEALVEKLCLRFRVTKTERQWRDLAFCLSNFTYSDKAVKKLIENFECFSDKLHEDSVYEAFNTIMTMVSLVFPSYI